MKKSIKKYLAMIMALSMVAAIFVGCAPAAQDSTNTPADTATTSDPASSTETNKPSETDAAASGEPIKIGVSAAITGAAPLDGERTMQGIEMAVEEINAAGGVNGRPLEMIVEDDQNTANIAVNVVNKLVNDPEIVAIIGPHRSANAMATEQIMADAKIPFLTGAVFPQSGYKSG